MFFLDIEIGQSILMIKKMAGCCEMRTQWFQEAWLNSCAAVVKCWSLIKLIRDKVNPVLMQK